MNTADPIRAPELHGSITRRVKLDTSMNAKEERDRMEEWYRHCNTRRDY